jgi:AraC-like DNA-binding protein
VAVDVAVRPTAVVHERVSTDDPNAAYEYLRTIYAEHTPQMPGDLSRFDFSLESTIAPGLRVARLRLSAGYRGTSALAHGVTVLRVREGTRVGISCGREEAAASVMLGPTWAPFTCGWESSAVVDTVTVDAGLVARVGADLSGLTPHQVAFRGIRPLSPALGRYWEALVDNVNEHVLAEEVQAPPLMLAEALRQVAAGMLIVFPNTTQTVTPRVGPISAEPATVRRAVEFIDANAHRDIGVADIADAVRVGVRGLQLAFRKHRDTTPLAYLRRVRMERAHQDLRVADPRAGDTVRAIASRWGFLHYGNFSAEYRRAYGCPPSETLRR